MAVSAQRCDFRQHLCFRPVRGAHGAPIRAPELALDAFSVLLTLQAIYVIIREVRADAQKTETA
jgi:hypothetical protein